MKLKKIVSGGQTGADIAALRVARMHGIATGGWMPRGCITTEGPHRDWLAEFGMREHHGFYKERTWANVKDSDGTIRFLVYESPGERCTMNAVRHYEKPHMTVRMDHISYLSDSSYASVVGWLQDNEIACLNIAGHSERTHPGTERYVMDWMIVFLLYLSQLS